MPLWGLFRGASSRKWVGIPRLRGRSFVASPLPGMTDPGCLSMTVKLSISIKNPIPRPYCGREMGHPFTDKSYLISRG